MKKIHSSRQSHLRLSILSLLFILINLSACSVKLAPSFNKGIVDGIIAANKEILEFFASIEEGTTTATYSQREEKYNRLIGAFEALSTQVKARKIPKNEVKTKVDALLAKRNITALAVADYPSANALDKVASDLKVLKGRDRSTNVGSGAIAPFKNQIVISIDQALTYEQFLERE